MTLKTTLAIFATISLLATSCSPKSSTAKLDQFFNHLNEKDEAMGSISIAKDNKTVYTRSIGYACINGAEKKPLDTSTRFRIGSITKMFTAVMILQLVEEGKLKLSDTLAKFFPQIPNADKINIAQLLSHRSGIRDIGKNHDFINRRHKPVTKDELVTIIANGEPDFEPGTKHSYSNYNYTLLGIIIEKLNEKSYEDALKERIISKINLKNTYAATSNIDTNKNECFSYRHFFQWQQMPETHISILFGAGSLISTPNDLTIFIRSLFEGKLISQKSLNQMKTMKDGYGFGMASFTLAGKTFYGHTGGIDGFGAALIYQPEEKLAIAYATNGKTHPSMKILSGVVDIYYGRPFNIAGF